MAIKLFIFQRILHRYREDTFYELGLQEGLDLFLAFGDHHSKKYKKYSSIKYEPRIPSKRLFTFSLIFNLFNHINQFFLSPGLLKPLKKFHPDVVLTEGTANIVNNLILCTYCLIKNIPYIWWDLGHIRGQESENLFRRLLYPTILFYMRRAAVILGYSTYAKEYFISIGIPESKIIVAMNTVRLEKHVQYQENNKDRVNGLLKQINMADDIIFLAVGGLDYAKRFDLLINAFRELHKYFKNIGLIIVGDGPDRESLYELAENHEKIYFAGAQFEDVGLYFMAGNIFVLPGLGGLAINEAMVYGLPVISAPADGTELDLITDHETGFLIGINDQENLYGKMKWFVDHPDKINKMGKTALNKITTSHSFNSMIRSIHQSVIQANNSI